MWERSSQIAPFFLIPLCIAGAWNFLPAAYCQAVKHTVCLRLSASSAGAVRPQSVHTYLHPGGTVLWVELEELLVEDATAVKLPELQFKLNVALEQLALGALSDCSALMGRAGGTKREVE